MEITINVRISCEAALMKALTALAMGKTSAPQCVESKAAATGETDGAITTGEGTATASRGTAAPVEAEKPGGGVPGGGVPGDMNAAPTGKDASAEVRKILAATRARLGAKAGSATYASLNAEFVRIARQLGAEKPTALTAGKVGEFKEICDTIMLDDDGESLAAPF